MENVDFESTSVCAAGSIASVVKPPFHFSAALSIDSFSRQNAHPTAKPGDAGKDQRDTHEAGHPQPGPSRRGNCGQHHAHDDKQSIRDYSPTFWRQSNLQSWRRGIGSVVIDLVTMFHLHLDVVNRFASLTASQRKGRGELYRRRESVIRLLADPACGARQIAVLRKSVFFNEVFFVR